MDVVFEDSGLADVDSDPSRSAGLGQGVDKKFRQRMQLIRAARDERDFYAMKSLHFEKLEGSKEDDRSMRLNDQWRLIIRFQGEAPNKSVVVVGIKDYH